MPDTPCGMCRFIALMRYNSALLCHHLRMVVTVAQRNSLPALFSGNDREALGIGGIHWVAPSVEAVALQGMTGRPESSTATLC